jgi:hypothetical protein
MAFDCRLTRGIETIAMKVTAATNADASLVGLTKADFGTNEATLARLSGSTRTLVLPEATPVGAQSAQT